MSTAQTDTELTVLMTVYNGAEYLKTSIAGILNQSYRDFEFLIIDDCSSDDSVAIIHSFRDSRIRLHCNPANLGQTRSLNRGLELARGKHIARMDADDWAFPGWLGRQLSFVQSHPEFTVVSTQAVTIDENGRIRKSLEACCRHEDVVLKSLTNSPINHVGAIMRRDVILEAGGYPEDFKVAADYELWSRLIRQGHKISSTQQPLVAIRVHHRSISIQESKSIAFQEIMNVIAKNFSALARRDLDGTEKILIGKLFYDLSALDYGDFKRAVRILKEAQASLIAVCALRQQAAGKKAGQIIKKIHIKRIFGEIVRGRLDEVRVICRDYLRDYGHSFIFTVLWLASFCGRIIVSFIPKTYENLLKLTAAVNFWRYGNILHSCLKYSWVQKPPA